MTYELGIKYDTIYGKHSNIPKCCIEFFVSWWRGRWNTEEGRRYDAWKDKHGRWSYIACPTCVRQKHINPLHCCNKFNPSCIEIRKILKRECGIAPEL
jgi:hypothetical protein